MTPAPPHPFLESRCRDCRFVNECPITYQPSCAPHTTPSEREQVLDEMCMRCPCLDWRPDNCENCLVGTMKAELRTPTEAHR